MTNLGRFRVSASTTCQKKLIPLSFSVSPCLCGKEFFPTILSIRKINNRPEIRA